MRKWRMFLLACLILIIMMAIYGRYIEPNMLLVSRVSIGSERLKATLSGTRLVMVADLHITNKITSREKRLLDKITELSPDYIIIAGDLNGYKSSTDTVIEWLKMLPDTKGNFAVLGDTDVMGGVKNCDYCHVPGKKEFRHDLPIVFLRDEARTIATNKGEVVIAGTDPEWIEPDLDFIGRKNASLPTILIAHYPETLRSAAAKGIDLVLSGDTHGGQIRGPKFLIARFFRQARADYLKGYFHSGQTEMYVTRGIGTSIIPVRIGAPPEVVVIDF